MSHSNTAYACGQEDALEDFLKSAGIKDVVRKGLQKAKDVATPTVRKGLQKARSAAAPVPELVKKPVRSAVGKLPGVQKHEALGGALRKNREALKKDLDRSSMLFESPRHIINNRLMKNLDSQLKHRNTLTGDLASIAKGKGLVGG